MNTPQKIQFIETEKLQFDPENPRFYRLNDASSVDAVIDEMFDDEGVQELMRSIGQKGYFEGEPLLVSPHKDGWIVVEGNRRLAATKLLNKQISPPKRRNTSVSQILADVQHAAPTSLPCIVYPTRRDVLRYLGYRHITGIKPWDALSKAKYLAQLRDEFYLDIEKPKQFKLLANDIGSRSDYVGKLLTALAIYEIAEGVKFFDLPIRPDDIEFSYLTTALGYTEISGWLGLQNSFSNEIDSLNIENLKHLFSWMFSKDQLGRTILGETRNFTELACVVKSSDAVKVLKDNGNFKEAYLYTDGPESALATAFGQAEERVRVIWTMLSKIQNLTMAHLSGADSLFERVKDVRNHIRTKLSEE